MFEKGRTSAGGVGRSDSRASPLCLETQGREVMAKLVHDVVAEAMRLNLYGAPKRMENTNGVRFGRGWEKIQYG